MLALLTATALGLLLGIRHAFEPDHLAAVSTLAADRPARGGFWLGALWGLGHTAALVAVGAALFVLKAALPERLEDAFELVVAAMLVVLGCRAFARMALGAPARPRGRTQSLFVGLAHGLAGSGALTALAAAAMPTATSCLLYMLVFGLGSAAGMGVMTLLADRGLSGLHLGARGHRGVLAAAGLFSVCLGIAWGVPRAQRLAGGERVSQASAPVVNRG